MRSEKDLLGIAISVGADNNGPLPLEYRAEINSHDDQILRILYDAPGFIKNLLKNEEIDEDEFGNPMQIRINVGEYNGPNAPLSYKVFIGGGLCAEDIQKLIDSSILEEAIEEARKDCLKRMTEYIKNNHLKEEIERIKNDLIKFISDKLDRAKLQCG